MKKSFHRTWSALAVVAMTALGTLPTYAAPPANDDIANAVTVTKPLPFSASTSTVEATIAADDPDCAGNDASVWYVFTPTANGDIEANTVGSDYDTTLSAYTGAPGSLVQIACNDDTAGIGGQSRIVISVTAGVTYRFMAAAFSGSPGGNLAFNVQVARPAPYVFTLINHPLGVGLNGTYAMGINSAGVVVGTYHDAGDVPHGYMLIRGQFSPIDHPLGVNGTFVRGVNDAKAVVGFYYDADFVSHGFVMKGGAYSTIDYPFANSTEAWGISASGEVVGTYDGHGFRFKHGVFTTIDNPLGGDPGNCGDNAAYGVNALGAVVGVWDNFCSGPPYQDAYLLKRGVYTPIHHPQTSDYCNALGINSVGVVVGWFSDTRGNAVGYSLKDGVYTDIVYPGSPDFTLAQGINDHGVVVGVAYNGGVRGFIATPVRDCR